MSFQKPVDTQKEHRSADLRVQICSDSEPRISANVLSLRRYSQNIRLLLTVQFSESCMLFSIFCRYTTPVLGVLYRKTKVFQSPYFTHSGAGEFLRHASNTRIYLSCKGRCPRFGQTTREKRIIFLKIGETTTPRKERHRGKKSEALFWQMRICERLSDQAKMALCDD